jgi:2-phosphosulfolactate phosphatase
MKRTVVIDYLPESVCRYRPGWAVVVVDVIRATTTAITAVVSGRRCFPAPSVEAARSLARYIDTPLLAGESSGELPAGFEMDNSPAQVASRGDTYRPLVLVSSSGTRAIHEAIGCEATYLGCYRNYSALPAYLSARHSRIAVVGAGSKGEFREEDQICCAWIAAGLMSEGYSAENRETLSIANRWRDATPDACLCSRSVDFLKRTGRLNDLDFILGHIDDLQAVFTVRHGEVKMFAADHARQPAVAEALES